ncbi:Unknown protein [Striga hermonthica]|uniref:F-box/LRR-repeat protein 15/At3g58940/PEG3-like LRR domain-containing protein n=1 Tax=Striga hermonthica TaxID=68872 RepID=A0A9N7NLF9_STRHE|nr:Unknown protein [Striga hermonthica]
MALTTTVAELVDSDDEWIDNSGSSSDETTDTKEFPNSVEYSDERMAIDNLMFPISDFESEFNNEDKIEDGQICRGQVNENWIRVEDQSSVKSPQAHLSMRVRVPSLKHTRKIITGSNLCEDPFLDYPRGVCTQLNKLHLCNCKLSRVGSVRFKRLRTLTLEHVQVDGGTLVKILSGCPLLSRLVFKHYVLFNFGRIEGRSIKIDVPNFERIEGHLVLKRYGELRNNIRLSRALKHFELALLFSHLTSLYLQFVILSNESLDLLSLGCPTLASLTLCDCSGFEEFHLASDSVKFLTISTSEILFKGVRICAPNIVRFDFAPIPLTSDTLSFTAHFQYWYSKVTHYSRMDGPDFDVTLWFLKLRRVLKSLSGSQIFLTLQIYGSPLDVPCGAVDGSRLLSDEPPVVVRNLEFTTSSRRESWYSDFMNYLFRVCRPSHVWNSRLVSESARNHRLSKFQFNILLANMSLGTFWRHDLEQVHVRTVNGKIWQLVEWTDLSELRNRTYDGKKWELDLNLISHVLDPCINMVSWFLKLKRMLEALSGSPISLSLRRKGNVSERLTFSTVDSSTSGNDGSSCSGRSWKSCEIGRKTGKFALD